MNEVDTKIATDFSGNKLAKSYIEKIEMKIEDQIKKDNPSIDVNGKKFKEEFNERLTAKVIGLHTRTDKRPFPIIAALQDLDVINDKILEMDTSLKAVKDDIGDKESGLLQQYRTIDYRLRCYTKNVKKASKKIQLLPAYTQQNTECIAMESKNKRLDIEKIKAETAKITALAEQQQANAMSSRTQLEWRKSWLWYFLGIKSN